MTTQTEALKLALELLAVGTFHSPELQAKRTEVIEKGLNALAQPEQEPVAWRVSYPDEPELGFWFAEGIGGEGCLNEPLYTTPPPVAEPHQRKPLTDEQIDSIADKFTVHTGDMWEPELCIEFNDSCKSVHSFARAIEAAHGIKEKNT